VVNPVVKASPYITQDRCLVVPPRYAPGHSRAPLSDRPSAGRRLARAL